MKRRPLRTHVRPWQAEAVVSRRLGSSAREIVKAVAAAGHTVRRWREEVRA